MKSFFGVAQFIFFITVVIMWIKFAYGRKLENSDNKEEILNHLYSYSPEVDSHC